MNQKSDGEAFLRIFPSEREVLAYFAPAKWTAALANADKCTCYSYMTLKLLDSTYSEGLANRLVENNIRGIYSLAKPAEPIIDNAVRRVAELFVAKYGSELSVFGALLYFAQYITDHKSTYGQFDMIDVLRQCAKSFLPKWRQRIGKVKERDTNQEEGSKERGMAALYTYLRQEYVAKGIDIRTSPIVKCFKLPEKELQFIESGEPLQF
ncbi:MAG: hypothetical protein J5529_08825 [Prevotella sp.]|nr:hypothetical protein [Prevotella sp.]